QAGHVPVISAMGNLPILKDLVVDMDPFWSKFKSMWPWLEPGYERPEDGREYRVSQERMNVVHKESLCINCGCCVSECNAMESDPEFLGPQALAKGMRFVGDPRDQANIERLERYNQEHGIWDCTRCYFCNERCPKGVDPRDAIAKLGAESIATWARSMRSGSCVPPRRRGGCARRSSFPRRRATSRPSSSSSSEPASRVTARFGPFPFRTRRGTWTRRAICARSSTSKTVRALRGSSRDNTRSRRSITGTPTSRSRRSTNGPARRRGRGYPSWRRNRTRECDQNAGEESRLLQGLPRLAVCEGAGQLDEGTLAHGGTG